MVINAFNYEKTIENSGKVCYNEFNRETIKLVDINSCEILDMPCGSICAKALDMLPCGSEVYIISSFALRKVVKQEDSL